MANAKLTPSGAYRCQVYIGLDENGRKKYKTITDKDKRRCERKAAEYADQHRQAKNDGTIGSAISRYISQKKAVLSPSTVRGYEVIERYFKTSHSAFCDRTMASVDKEVLQNLVNEMSASLKPKTVRNRYALITAVMEYNDYYTPKVHLPEKQKPNLHIPDTADIMRILEIVKDTDMEIPVLLAAFAPMRRSEICALTLKDIKGNVIHVRHALVPNENNEYVIKGTKTYESDRYIPMRQDIIDLIKEKGYVVPFTNPNIITSRFEHIAYQAGCPGTRFHDLRHWCASYLHAQGVPDQYIMARGGWRTDHVLKAVYRHELQSESNKWSQQIDRYFSDIKAN